MWGPGMAVCWPRSAALVLRSSCTAWISPRRWFESPAGIWQGSMCIFAAVTSGRMSTEANSSTEGTPCGIEEGESDSPSDRTVLHQEGGEAWPAHHRAGFTPRPEPLPRALRDRADRFGRTSGLAADYTNKECPGSNVEWPVSDLEDVAFGPGGVLTCVESTE